MGAILALFSLLLAVTPATAQTPPPPHAVAPHPTPILTPDQLFSRRALRQARLLIQMRLLQLRDERLECVREALMRQLPAELWPEPPPPMRGSSGATAVGRCSQLQRI